MAVLSYSFHISNGSNAVSNGGKLARVGKHNLRGYSNGSDLGYDQGEIEILVGGSDLVADVKQAYHDEFDAALQDFNAGKRSDRQIEDYFDKVSADTKKDLAVEAILQIGDMDYWAERKVDGHFTYADTQRMTYVFRQQIKTLQERCPDFKIVSAVAHYDESSPHLHIVGVPIGRDYKRGMSKQVAKTKVFTPESLRDLQDTLRQAMLIQMQQAGYEVELRTKQQGRNRDYEKGALQGLNKAIKEKQQTLDEVTEATVKAQISAVEQQKNLSQIKNDILKGESQLSDISQTLVAKQILLDTAQNELKGAQESLKAVKGQISGSREYRDSLMADVTNCQNELSSLRSEIRNQESTLNSLRKDVKGLQAEKEGALAIIQEAGEITAMFEDLLDVYNEQQVQAAKTEADSVFNEIKDDMLPDEKQAYRAEDIGALEYFFDTRCEDKGHTVSYAARNYLKAPSRTDRVSVRDSINEIKDPGRYQPKRSGWFWATFREMIDKLRNYFTEKNKLTLPELVESYRANKRDEAEIESHYFTDQTL